MKKIKIVRANRGFWRDLFSVQFKNFSFVNEKISSTEDIVKNSKSLAWKISRLRILDFLGIFQVVKIKPFDNFDYVFSYNRFVKTDKPYVVAVENPSAMVHYSFLRSKSFLGRYNLKKVFNNTNIKAFCCMSKACESTMRYYYDIPESVELYQIYPYIKDEISQNEMKMKVMNNTVNCLFISSDFNLKGGNELLYALKTNRLTEDDRIHVDIITKVEYLNNDIIEEIRRCKNISLYDFKFTKDELNGFYKKANILINMTRMDSFSLVTLEALKYGCAFISTDMYAIREMVHNEKNGFLTHPSVSLWNIDNTRNMKVSKKEKTRLNEAYVDKRIGDFLAEKLLVLINDKQRLIRMQQESYNISQTEFSCMYIKRKWEEVFESMKEEV